MPSDGNDEESALSSSHLSQGSGWRPVDRKVWERRQDEPKEALLRFGLLIRATMGDIFSSPLFLLFFALPAGASVVFTFALAYYVGGALYMGPVFVGIWACIIISGILLLEKTGTARNFAGWDLPLKRIILLPVGFLVTLGFFYLMIMLSHSIR